MIYSVYFPRQIMALAVGFAISGYSLAEVSVPKTSLKELTVTASHTEQDVLNVDNTAYTEVLIQSI